MGDWKSFSPAAFERACKDEESEAKRIIFQRALTESTNEISGLAKQGYKAKRFSLSFPYPEDVLEKVRARLIDENPALAPHLCIENSSLTYARDGARARYGRRCSRTEINNSVSVFTGVYCCNSTVAIQPIFIIFVV